MLAASQNRSWWTLFKARNLNPCCMMIIGTMEWALRERPPCCHQQHLDKRNCSPSSSSSIDTSKLVRCFWHFVSSDEIVCWREVNTKSNFVSFRFNTRRMVQQAMESKAESQFQSQSTCKSDLTEIRQSFIRARENRKWENLKREMSGFQCELTVANILVAIGNVQQENSSKIQAVLMDHEQQLRDIKESLVEIKSMLSGKVKPSEDSEKSSPGSSLEKVIAKQAAGGVIVTSTPVNSRSRDADPDYVPETGGKPLGKRNNSATLQWFNQFFIFIRNLVQGLQSYFRSWLRRVYTSRERDVLQAVSMPLWKALQEEFIFDSPPSNSFERIVHLPLRSCLSLRAVLEEPWTSPALGEWRSTRHDRQASLLRITTGDCPEENRNWKLQRKIDGAAAIANDGVRGAITNRGVIVIEVFKPQFKSKFDIISPLVSLSSEHVAKAWVLI